MSESQTPSQRSHWFKLSKPEHVFDHIGRWRRGKRALSLSHHRNPGIELVLVRRGHVSWNIAGRHVSVGPSDITFTLPWETHGPVDPLEQLTVELDFLTIRLDRDYEDREKAIGFHDLIGLDRDDTQWASEILLGAEHRALRAHDHLARLIEIAISNEERAEPDSRAYAPFAQGVAKSLVMELVRAIDSRSGSPAAEVFSPTQHGDQLVSRFLETLPKSLEHQWSVSEMAMQTGLGKTQFSRLVAEQTGDTPIAYLNRLRIAKATKLLITSRHNVTRIAQMCGFSTSQYFSRVFREYLDTSPTEYRDNHRAE